MKYELMSRARGIRRATRLVILAAVLGTHWAHADPEDLTLPCPGVTAHTFSADDGGTLNEDIVSTAGGNVFWELSSGTWSGAGMCMSTLDGDGLIESFSCPNGVAVNLPAGAPGTAVPNTAAVMVTATPAAGVGFVTFTLTATLASDGSQTCTRPFTVDVFEPTEPFDVSWVLDRSGSMGSTSNIIGGAGTRWDVLVDAARLFVPLLQASGEEAGNSRFGMSLFASSVLPNPLGSPLVTIDGGFGTTVNAALEGHTPSGSTAMGGGLQAGMSKMTNSSRPRVVMLFTDGEQNVNPRVDAGGCGFINPSSPINAGNCPATPSTTGAIKIITIGIGSPADGYLATLEQLAANNRGAYLVTNNGETFGGDGLGNIIDTFANAVLPALSGASPQQVAAYAGALGSAPVTLEGFDVNRSVDRLLLSIAFDRRMELPDRLRILSGMRIARDGDDLTAQFEPVVLGSFGSTATLIADFDNESGFDPAGEYVVTFNPVPRTTSPGFKLWAFVDDHRLGVNSAITPAERRVGQPIQIGVELDWLGKSIEGADVEVTVLGPQTDLGQALTDNPTIVDPASGPDAGSPGQQKYEQLVANDPAFLSQLALVGSPVTMTDQGGGAYRGSFTPGSVSDVHQVAYRVTAADPLFGHLQRTWTESIYVRYGPIDMSASNPTVQALPNGRMALDFTPIRAEGLALGPGRTSFAVNGMTLVEVQDHQDGRYTLTLEGGSADTPIEVTLLGETVYAGPVSGFGGRGGLLDQLIDLLASLPWWLWLLILLLIIVLIVLRRRSASP